MKSVGGPFAILLVCALLFIVLLPFALVFGLPAVISQGVRDKARSNDATAAAPPPMPSPTIAVTPPSPITLSTSADGQASGGAINSTNDPLDSDTGQPLHGVYVGNGTGGTLTFHVNVPVAGKYTLHLRTFFYWPGRDHTMQVSVNGKNYSITIGRDAVIDLQAGNNTIILSGEDGYNNDPMCNASDQRDCLFIAGVKIEYQEG